MLGECGFINQQLHRFNMDNQPIDNSIAQTPGLPTPGQLTDFRQLENKDGFYFSITIPGTSAQTAVNFGYIFTARFPIEILRVTEVHETAGTDAGAVTLDVLRVPSGTAIGSGTSILASTFNLKSTAATPVYKQGLNLSSTTRRLKENESLALKTSGTLTALADVCVTIYYQNYGRGSYK